MDWYSVRMDDGTAHVAIGDNLGAFGAGADSLLEEIKHARDVQLAIHSDGGDACVGTKLYDALRGRVSSAVITRCSSSALAVALTADHIAIFADAKIMIHPPSKAVLGTAADLRQSADFLDKLTARWREILNDRVGDIDTVCKWLAGPDYWLSADAALQFGLVDSIIRRPKTSEAQVIDEPSPETAATPRERGNDDLFFEFLRAFGPVKTADKKKFGRNLSAWFGSDVQETSK